MNEEERKGLAAVITHVSYRGRHGRPSKLREDFEAWLKACDIDAAQTLAILQRLHDERVIVGPLYPYEPLAAEDLFKLKAGDKFVAFWAKDNDLEDTRLNYATQTVLAGSDEDTVFTEDGYEWSRDEIDEADHNEMQTGRGIAYLFKYPS